MQLSARLPPMSFIGRPQYFPWIRMIVMSPPTLNGLELLDDARKERSDYAHTYREPHDKLN